jgi:hypothetical protein
VNVSVQNESDSPNSYDETFNEVTELLDTFIKNPRKLWRLLSFSSEAAGDLYSDLANLEASTEKNEKDPIQARVQARAAACAYCQHIKDLHSKGKDWPRLAAFLPDWLNASKDETPAALLVQIEAALGAADRAVSDQGRKRHRESAVELSCKLAKKLGMKGEHVEIYRAAGHKHQREFYKWRLGEIPSGRAADTAIRRALLDPKPTKRS